jgi:cytochrome c biogenesis protein CcdA/thiol-disulfide isomerase/thioredoxin
MGVMALLIVFAFVAGAGTALSPCVLPVLPALLSAGAAGGRRRPLGIVVGLAVTFTIAIVALGSLIDGVGLADGLVRDLAVVVLAGFGIALLVPAIGDRIEAALSRLHRFGPKGGGEGFRSGVAVGGALGFVYAPCAGPILAAVISVGATQGASAELVAVGLAYATGSALVLLALAYGGRRVAERVRRAGRGPVLQQALGAVMVATAIAVAADLDVRFQTALADDFPDVVVNPTRALEESGAVEDRLADLRGRPRFESKESAREDPVALPVLGTAPDFQDTGEWFNTAPLSLGRLRDRVVLIDFWTYTCINCLRTLPHLKAWDRRYRDRGLTIVGVHTPEFGFERDAGNVRRAVDQNGLRYPVVQDNDYGTWEAWGNQYWPAKYLIDARGKVRYTHFGEGAYDATEEAIRALLAERGSGALGARSRAKGIAAAPGVRTPETYLGFERAQGFVPSLPVPGTRRYPGPGGALPPNAFSLAGTWSVGPESATAVSGARLDARFKASKVYLVLGSRDGRPRELQVELDGRPYREVTVREQRLYTLVSLPRVQDRTLTLRVPPGVTGYAFTFG